MRERYHKTAARSIHMNRYIPASLLPDTAQKAVNLFDLIQLSGVGIAENGGDRHGVLINGFRYPIGRKNAFGASPD